MASSEAAIHGINYTGESRRVVISASAPFPPSLGPNVATTNTPSGPFVDPSLEASGQVNWSQVNGWTPPPTLASAVQDVSFATDQISITVDLVTQVGGDPYGMNYDLPYSGTALASSLFSVSFNVDTEMSFQYAFDFGFNSCLQNADLHLISLNGLDMQLFNTSGLPQEGTVTLLPGEDYTLMFSFACEATGDKFGGSSSTLDFSVLAVPEPQVAALLVLGGVLVGWARRGSGRSRGRF